MDTSSSWTVGERSRTGRENRILPGQQFSSTTALPVWWFGGTGDQEAIDDDSDSCELVAVRIDKTSANSRRISGDIVVPTTLVDVWSILTDYNRLSIHVPNLVESKVTASNSRGSPGDGSYTCRLYQKGAQKIVGFKFGADVTMDMKEAILPSTDKEQRSIGFKCVDSLFFSEFDGEWLVQDLGVGLDGLPQTMISYQVDVRPKGPVPVAALEWRIREDVPTNLRAVKRASLQSVDRTSVGTKNGKSQEQSRLQAVRVNWLEDETMAAYLKQN